MINPSQSTEILILVVGLVVLILGITLIIYGYTSWTKKSSRISDRLDQYVARDEEKATKPKRRILLREASGSLFSRTIGSWGQSLVGLIWRYTPQKNVDRTEHQLGIAGYPMGLHAGAFYLLRVVIIILGLLAAYMINSDFHHLQFTQVLIGALLILMAYLLPNTWLNGKVRARQDEIRRGLPDCLDMLSVCAAAGLGFDQSLQKISDYWGTELGREFKRTLNEMEMGVSRTTALTNMSNRLDVDDLTSFITIIIQAEQMGMSYADVLHSQAMQLRVMRQYRAREIANKLPAKMIIPLALFIFPAIIIVILSPVFPRILNIF